MAYVILSSRWEPEAQRGETAWLRRGTLSFGCGSVQICPFPVFRFQGESWEVLGLLRLGAGGAVAAELPRPKEDKKGSNVGNSFCSVEGHVWANLCEERGGGPGILDRAGDSPRF